MEDDDNYEELSDIEIDDDMGSEVASELGSDMDIVDTISDIPDNESEGRKRGRESDDEEYEEEESGDYKRVSKGELVRMIMEGELDLEPNLQNIDLSDTDLQNANLENSNLYEANLQKAFLNGAILTDSNLTLANLEDANLQFAVVGNTIFNGANLKNANLENLSQRESDDIELSYLYFYYADLTNAEFTNNIFYEGTLFFCDFTKSMYIPSFDLSAAKLDGINFSGSNFTSIYFSDLSIIGGKFNYFEKKYDREPTSLTDCFFNNSNLSNSSFNQTVIYRNNFTNAILTNTNFNEAMINNTIFRNANFQNAKLINCELEYIDFVGANLQGVDFSNSYFKKVDFTNADLTGAIVDGAVFKEIVLNGTKIDGIDFSKAKEIKNIQLDIRPIIPIELENIFVGIANNEEREQERIAYQVHDYFERLNINLNNVINSIKVIVGKDDSFYIDIPNIAKYFETQVISYLNNPELYKEDISTKERIISKLRLLINKLESSSSSRDDGNKVIIGNIIDFVMLQSNDFKKFYIESFIEDCSEAYGEMYSPEHRLSCVKGIIENIILVLLNTISIYKCNETSEEICNKIKEMSEKKFGQEDLNRLTQEWLASVDLDNPENKRKYGEIIDNPILNKNQIFKDDYLKYVYYYLNKNGLLNPETKKMVNEEANKYEEMGVFGRLEFGGGSNSIIIKNKKQNKKNKSKKNKKTIKKNRKVINNKNKTKNKKSKKNKKYFTRKH